MTCCCTLAVVFNLLATTISSSSITNFISIPSNVPPIVASSYTFGSEDHTNATHRVTSNTVAAVKSLFNAYYERIYYKSAGSQNDHIWNTNSFGQTGFKQMSFTNGVVFGEREPFAYGYRNGTNGTHRLVEWPWILSFSNSAGNDYLHNLVESYNQIIYRDTWDKSPGHSFNYWSSSLMTSRRLPPEFDWTDYAPTASQFDGCLPIFAFAEDEGVLHYNSRRENNEKYPLSYPYEIFDSNYYWIRVSPIIENTKLTQTFLEFLDERFPGSNALNGMQDLSRRLKPDNYSDYYKGDSSSLLATASRVLSVLDRTYELPLYVNGFSHVISNQTVEAGASLDIDYYGSADNLQFTMDDVDTGRFTCNQFTDNDLSFDSETGSKTTNTTYSTNFPSDRDKGRFSGTSTSVNHTLYGMTNYCGITVLENIFDFIPISYPIVGTNHVNIVPSGMSVDNKEIIYHILDDTYGIILGGFGFNISHANGQSTLVKESVRLSRSATSEWTFPATMEDVRNILPVAVPCGSAFEGGANRLAVDPYVSFFKFAIKYLHEELGDMSEGLNDDVTYIPSESSDVDQVTVFRKVSGNQLTSPQSLAIAYLNARNETRAKMMSAINDEVANWTNPSFYTDRISRSSISEENAGSRVVFSGGTFKLHVSIASVPVAGTYFVAIVEPINSEYLAITRLGYVIGDNNYVWFNDKDFVSISIAMTPDNTGDGYTIDTDRDPEMRAVSCDALAIPLVTTDWNWRSLKAQ